MDFENPPSEPISPFKQWLEEAGGIGLRNPNAMALATVDPEAGPSVRTVLLKGIDERGAVFFTNRDSRKGRQLAAVARAAVVFYWDALGRQVSIEGAVSTVDDAESDAYFTSRSLGAQIGAAASAQSQPVENRAALDARVLQVATQFGSGPIPRPQQWGGYRIQLERIEFWQNRDDRLHDRVVYTRTDSGAWQTQRLWP